MGNYESLKNIFSKLEKKANEKFNKETLIEKAYIQGYKQAIEDYTKELRFVVYNSKEDDTNKVYDIKDIEAGIKYFKEHGGERNYTYSHYFCDMEFTEFERIWNKY